MNIFQKWKQKNIKKNDNNQEVTQAMTLEEIKKAYAELSDDDKKSFKQSVADRVDESVGEQISEKGEKDTQTTKDRVDEDKGAEKAEKGEHADAVADATALGEIMKRLEALEAKMDGSRKEPKKVDDDKKDKLDWIAERYR